MSKTHFSALISKHSHLDALLASESQRPLPDARRMTELKKRKLRLKDALVSH
jgi:hypothetical protein